MRVLFIAILLGFKAQLLACALCAMMTPTAHVYMDIRAVEGRIKQIEISWVFSKSFTDLTFQTYDYDSSGILESSEIDDIEFAMIDYLKDKNFLMRFEHYKSPDGKTFEAKGEFSGARFLVEDERLVFKFEQNLDLLMEDDLVLKVSAYDENGYFNFTFLNSNAVMIDDKFHAVFNSNLGASFASFSSGKMPEFKQKNLKDLLKASQVDSSNSLNFINQSTVDSLKSLKELLSTKDISFKMAALIILLSFVYGFFHAAGPGHAKVLTTSYFLANGGDIYKVLKFSLKIGFFHIIGAFLVVIISMFITTLVATSLSSEAFVFTTRISGIMIVGVAIFMVISKIKNLYDKYQRRWQIFDREILGIQNLENLPNLAHDKGCGCHACSLNLSKSKSVNEWIIALSAAIIPCPGTILVFLLAFSVGSYFISVVSAFFMGLGMSFVIFIAAVFGSSLNKLSSKNFDSFGVYVEFFGLGVMIVLGIFMIVISGNLGVL